jgi:hypothetical protein
MRKLRHEMMLPPTTAFFVNGAILLC